MTTPVCSSCCAPRCDYKLDQTIVGSERTNMPCFPTEVSPSQLGFGELSKIAMSSDGSVLVVGASVDNAGFSVKGAVFVYERNVSFAFCATQKEASKFGLVQILQVSENDTVDPAQFGYSVDISSDGNRIVVGAPFQDSSSELNAGKVYIFDRFSCGHSQSSCSLQKWYQTQTIVAQKRKSQTDCTVEDEQNIIQFGVNLALSGDGTVLIVTNFDNSLYIYEDSCRLVPKSSFSKEHSKFQFAQRIDFEQISTDSGIPVSDLGFNIGNGLTVNANGNIVAFSLSFSTVSDIFQAGTVFIYERCQRSENWKYLQYLESDTTLTEQRNFGINLDMTPCGKFLAVEAVEGNAPSISNGFGVVYVREKASCRYHQYGNLLESGDNVNTTQTFKSIAITDNGCTVAIGYENTTVLSEGGAGSVVIYKKICTKDENGNFKIEWKNVQTLKESNPSFNDFFGESIAIDSFGETLAVATFPNPAEVTVRVFTSLVKRC